MSLRKLFIFGGLGFVVLVIIATATVTIFFSVPTKHAHATGGAATLIGHVSGAGGTVALNTTGASMIAVCYGASTAGQASNPVSDSLGNTWQLATYTHEDGDVVSSLWYSVGPITGTSDTFTASGFLGAISVMAFSGVASGPDQQNSAPSSVAGNVTPSNPNELVISCDTQVAPYTTFAISSPFTVVDSLQYATGTSNAWYLNSGYTTETTIATVDPSWTAAGAPASVDDTFYSDLSPANFSITTTRLNEAFNGNAYSMQLTANGGIGPFTWSLISGTLPTGLNFSSSGLISGTPTQTVLRTPLTFQITDSNNTTVSVSLPLTVAAAPLAITTTTCPPGTQLSAYSGCNLAATGGTPPYTYTWCGEGALGSGASCGYQSLVEGLTLNDSTGLITGSEIMGQGGYQVQFTVTDGVGQVSTQAVYFAIAGNNTFGGDQIFPSDSAFHQRVDELPTDTAPFADIWAPYTSTDLKPLFGPDPGGDGGIPINTVPYTQPDVAVNAQLTNFASAPIPCDAAMEGTRNTVGDGDDNHVLVVQTAGGGKPASLWEMYQVYNDPDCSWGDGASDDGQGGAAVAFSPDSTPSLASYTAFPQDTGTADAAGLPVAPLLLNYDEVAGGCGIGSECGVVKHPIRFTEGQTLDYHVWPATAQAGFGQHSCIGGYEDGNALLSQSNPPTSCSGTSVPGQGRNPEGEIYRLPASVPTPSACLTNNVDKIIITGLRDYGIILADNGGSGYFIGTPDSRWPAYSVLANCFNALTLGEFTPVKMDPYAVNWPDSIQMMSSTPEVDESGGGGGGGGNPPDTTPPTTSITSPSNNATVSSTISVTATASDDVGVTSVGLYIDNSLASTDNSSPYSFSVNTTNLSNGSHTLVTKASDAAGNIGTSGAITINVANATSSPDTTPPTTPTGLTVANVTASSISLSWSPSSDNVGVTGYNIYRGGVKIGTANTTSYTNSGLLPSTSYSYTVSAYDAAGNTSSLSGTVSGTTSALPVTTGGGGGGGAGAGDTTPPTASITSPANNANASGTLSITASASDNVRVASVSLYVDGIVKATDTASPYTFSLDTRTLSNGTHTLLVKAADSSGNLGISGNVVITTTNTASTPIASSTPPTQNTTPTFEITSVSVTNITGSSAQLTVTTHAPASIVVKYGRTTSFGFTTSASPILTTNYENLTNLTPSTVYDLIVIATPEGGTSVTSQVYAFETTVGSTAGPVASSSPSASGSPAPVFTTNLAYGDTGSQVTLLQQILRSQGFLPTSVAITGDFGTQTEHALLLFQAAHDLNKSGFVDVQSEALLNKVAAAEKVTAPIGTSATNTIPGTTPAPATVPSGSLTRNLTIGSTGADVTVLQHLLQKDGDYSSTIFSTYYGAITEAAVKVFQTKHNIINHGSPTTTGYGAVGPKTRGELDTL